MSNVVRLKRVEKTTHPEVKCHFKLQHHIGRGSNRRAIYVCQSHAYPSGCLPAGLKPFKVTK